MLTEERRVLDLSNKMMNILILIQEYEKYNEFIYLLIIKAGAPIEQFPKDDWNYVHHEIMDGGDNIYIWANYTEKGNRLYKIEYDRETAKKLQEAKNKTQAGIPQSGQFLPGGNSNSYPSLFIADRSELDGEAFIKTIDP